jgi:acyl carrier protein
MNAGVDSLLAVEVRNRLNADMDVKLPPTCILDYPTITAIVENIMETSATPREPKHTTAPPQT